jgi:hypothetical protein
MVTVIKDSLNRVSLMERECKQRDTETYFKDNGYKGN